MNIPHSKRKRVVYGNLKYKHKQSFDYQHEGNTISFTLFDPNDTRAELTLLHMPINTTPEIIRYIFNTLNPAWRLSDIRLEPGIEQRHDRWQLMIECSNWNEIPHCFILPKRGQEREDLTIKVFVTGRVSPCVHCHGEHRSNQCPNPPPPRPESRRAAHGPPRHTHSSRKPRRQPDWNAIMNSQPEDFKALIEHASNDKNLSICKTLQNILLNNTSASDIVKDYRIDEAKKVIPGSVNNDNDAVVFSGYSHLNLKEKQDQATNNLSEFEEKIAAAQIFIQLFGAFKLHSHDLHTLEDFTYGQSSYDRFVVWLCQYAEFLDFGTKSNIGEIPAIEQNVDIR